MNIQTINDIVNPAIEGIIKSLENNNISLKKTVLKKIINQSIEYHLTGKKSFAAETAMMFSGRGKAWAKIDADCNLFNVIINTLKEHNSSSINTTNLVDLFTSSGFAWLRFSGSNNNNILFDLRYNGSKLEDSISFRASYSDIENIKNLEGVPHHLGLESGNFSLSEVIKKETLDGDHTSINSNIISLEDII